MVSRSRILFSVGPARTPQPLEKPGIIFLFLLEATTGMALHANNCMAAALDQNSKLNVVPVVAA